LTTLTVIASLFGKYSRPTRRRRHSARLVPILGPEPLEGRALMALISSVGFDPKGQEIAEVIYNKPDQSTGALQTILTPGYVKSGPLPLFTDFNSTLTLRSASIAFDKAGDVLQDLVNNQGVATQYVNYVNGFSGQIVLGSGVESISVAFEPDGTGVSDVVYEDGSYYEFTSTGGSTLVASNVVSASVAIDAQGNKLQDYVTADEVAHEISTAAATPADPTPTPTTTTLGTNVVSSGVAFDGNGGVVRAVVFSNGTNYQYDYAGAHLSPAPVFQIITQHILGSTSLVFNPFVGDETATITFPQTGSGALNGGTTIQYRSSGGALQADSQRGGLLTSSTTFGPNGKTIQEIVFASGNAFQINPDGGGFTIGSDVQSVNIAFDPQGNEVADVVYMNGEYYEFDSSGHSTLIASDVVSASVAIDKAGDKLQDYATADGVAHEISSPAPATPGGTPPTPTTATLGTEVVSISVAYDGNGGIARSVLFTNGLAYQYDYAGQHLQGQVFNPLLYNPKRLALTAGLTSY
jgi:hypothetical protein